MCMCVLAIRTGNHKEHQLFNQSESRNFSSHKHGADIKVSNQGVCGLKFPSTMLNPACIVTFRGLFRYNSGPALSQFPACAVRVPGCHRSRPVLSQLPACAVTDPGLHCHDSRPALSENTQSWGKTKKTTPKQLGKTKKNQCKTIQKLLRPPAAAAPAARAARAPPPPRGGGGGRGRGG